MAEVDVSIPQAAHEVHFFTRETRLVQTIVAVVAIVAASLVGGFVEDYPMWLRVLVSVVTLLIVAAVGLGVAHVVRSSRQP